MTSYKSALLKLLDERGYIHQLTDAVALDALADREIVPGYIGYRIHVVRPGDTLSAIADANYGNSDDFDKIVRANPLIISDPNLIFVGQALKIPIGV